MSTARLASSLARRPASRGERRLVPGEAVVGAERAVEVEEALALAVVEVGKIDAGAAPERRRLLVDDLLEALDGALQREIDGHRLGGPRRGRAGALAAELEAERAHAASGFRSLGRCRTGGRRRGSGRRGGGLLQVGERWPRARARAARRRRDGWRRGRCAGGRRARAVRCARARWPSFSAIMDFQTSPAVPLPNTWVAFLGSIDLDEALQDEGLELAEGIGAALAPVAGRRPSAARRDWRTGVRSELRRPRGQGSPATRRRRAWPRRARSCAAASRPRRDICRAPRQAPRQGRYR